MSTESLETYFICERKFEFRFELSSFLYASFLIDTKFSDNFCKEDFTKKKVRVYCDGNKS